MPIYEYYGNDGDWHPNQDLMRSRLKEILEPLTIFKESGEGISILYCDEDFSEEQLLDDILGTLDENT